MKFLQMCSFVLVTQIRLIDDIKYFPLRSMSLELLFLLLWNYRYSLTTLRSWRIFTILNPCYNLCLVFWIANAISVSSFHHFNTITKHPKTALLFQCQTRWEISNRVLIKVIYLAQNIPPSCQFKTYWTEFVWFFEEWFHSEWFHSCFSS